MNTEYYFTDSATSTLLYDGASVTEETPTPSDVETVTLDSPWNDFFETDEYVQFDATVAQPIVQPYFYDGELQYFKKDEQELQTAQAQIDNTPWTTGHPPDKHLTDASQIRGFWTDPVYNDGQQATLTIPANDEDAVQFALDTGQVSVGFRGRLDWVDGDDVEHDAVQRDIVYDHIASVDRGRCSPEDGCGIDVADGTDQHGHVYTDAVQTTKTEGITEPQYAVGDWVQWEWGDGTATGRVDAVQTDETIMSSGARLDPKEEGKPVYGIEHWDESSATFGNYKVAVESDLSSTGKPQGFTDECSPGPCSCGRHVDGTIMDTIEYDGLMGGDLDKSEIPDPPEHRPHYVFDAETKGDSSYPLVDGDGQLRRGNVKAAWELYGKAEDESLLLDVLAQANKRFADAEGYTAPIPEDSLSEAMNDGSTQTMTTIKELLNDSDVTKQDVLDHYEIEQTESPTEFYDGEPTPDELAEDFEAVDMLIEEKETLEDTVDELEQQVRAAKRPIFEDKAEELAELTDRWGNAEEIAERFDAEDDEQWTVDDIEQKIELVEDIKGTSTTTPSRGDGDGEESTLVADNDGTVSDSEIDKTQGGRYDLRDRR